MAMVAASRMGSSIASTRSGVMRLMSTSSMERYRREPHEFSKPSEYVRSWVAPDDPREAQKKLAKYRREYWKQVREVRKQYIYEMEMQRLEKERKDEARREAVRLAREQRQAAKSAIAQSRAAERKLFEDQFRETLLQERMEKLQLWRSRGAKVQQKKDDKKELLRRQSSMWIDENELEKKLTEVLIDTTPL